MDIIKPRAGWFASIFLRFEKEVWVTNIVNCINWIGYSICFPLMMAYLHNERGLPASLAGTTLLAIAIPGTVTSILGGVFTDKFGRRRLVLIIAASIIPLSITAAFLIWASAPIWVIVSIVAIIMLLLNLAHAILRVIIADVSPKNRLSESFGLLSISMNVGWAAGTALAGLLVAFLSYTWLWIVLSLLSSISFILILCLLRESQPGQTEQVSLGSVFSIIAHDRYFFAFISLSLLVLLVLAQITNALSIFTIDFLGLSTSQFGFLLTINGLIIVFAQYGLSWITDRIGESKALIIGSFLFGGYLLFGWLKGFSGAVFIIVIVTIAEMLFLPTISSVAARLSPPSQRGRYIGLLAFVQTLATSVAPVLGGVLLDAFQNTPQYSWGILASMAFIASLGFWRWSKGYPVK